MMAAYAAAESGHAVTLLEQNEKLGKKLFITGKGRCNLTNASDMEQLFANVVSNRKFLYSAFYSYDNEQVISFFESHGMPTKTERGNRVFPVSDHSSDVIAALSAALREQHVEVFLHTKVKRLLLEKRDEEKRVTGVELADHTKMHADAVIVATGGISYPSTGATGDGYRMAEESGHKMVSPTPALVPMEMKEPWVRDLQGLSLRNVRMSVTRGKKKLYEDFGEMLFTHFGVSGPLVLSAIHLFRSGGWRSRGTVFQPEPSVGPGNGELGVHCRRSSRGRCGLFSVQRPHVGAIFMGMAEIRGHHGRQARLEVRKLL